MRITLLLRSLHRGGAEQQVILLADGLTAMGHEVCIVTFYPEGELLEKARTSRAEYLSLGKKSRWDWLVPGRRLRRHIKSWRPHILYSFLTEPNLAASLCRPKSSGTKVIWGLRTANMDLILNSAFLKFTFRLGTLLSPKTDAIVFNSRAGLDYHRSRGYCSPHMEVIPNGFDMEHFRFAPAKRKAQRETWGVGADDILIGLSARLDPIKDHAGFLRAAALLTVERSGVKFVCIGGGNPELTRNLKGLAHSLGLGETVVWAGECGDMPAAYSALDLNTSSSLSEGFSNAIGEAMACGAPCVVTDVGDSAHIVGDTGVAVPPGRPEELAAAWRILLDRLQYQPDETRRAARDRVRKLFSRQAMLDATLELFGAVRAGRAPGNQSAGQ